MINEKQQRFCEEYLIDLNATQAAIRAGYSYKTAGQIGEQNLKKLQIKEYLQQRQKELRIKTGITQEMVLAEYAKIAFTDIRKLFNEAGSLKNITQLDEETAAAVAGFDITEEKTGILITGYTKKIKLLDKIRALDSLARHLGMFEKDNELHTQTITVNIGYGEEIE